MAEQLTDITVGKRRQRGRVVSTKMNKTIVVEIERVFRHPFYGKVLKRSKKYKVHDEHNTARLGDVVELAECRPLSKTKHMMLLSVVAADKDGAS